MNRSSYAFLAFALLFAAGHTDAQMSAGYSSLIFPHSVTSAGMGEQSVTMMNAADAMRSNPANLVYTEPGSVSFFRNPWMIIADFIPALPLTSVSTSLALSNGAHVGLEYTDWNWGDMYFTSVENPAALVKRHFYERSIAGAYAMPLGSEWALGAHLRYAWTPYAADDLSNDLLFSAGATYTPEALEGRLHAGASLMNFGMPMDAYETPTPAQMNLAADCAVLRQPLYDLTLALGFTKPLDKRDSSGHGYSSFRSLFTSWDDFPNGITTHIGLGYIWKPMPLGAGVSFFQEMYLGCFFTGLSEGNSSFFTHGVRAGIEAWGVKASAGYAGRWHNNHNASYMPWVFPWETVQFTLSTDQPLFGGSTERLSETRSLHSIVVSGGYAACEQTGRMKEETTGNNTLAFREKSVWSFESDFYLNENSAVTAALSYAYINSIIRPTGWIDNRWTSFEFGIETFSFTSGYRYHPVEALHPLFLQASLGIARLNPIPRSTPRYSYKLVDELAIGCALTVPSTGVVIMPKAGVKTLWMEIATDADKLGGYHQFEFGMNIGYMF